MGADAVLGRLGTTGMKIIEKLMGLLVTVIAVQLMIDGLSPLVSGLMGWPDRAQPRPGDRPPQCPLPSARRWNSCGIVPVPACPSGSADRLRPTGIPDGWPRLGCRMAGPRNHPHRHARSPGCLRPQSPRPAHRWPWLPAWPGRKARRPRRQPEHQIPDRIAQHRVDSQKNGPGRPDPAHSSAPQGGADRPHFLPSRRLWWNTTNRLGKLTGTMINLNY